MRWLDYYFVGVGIVAYEEGSLRGCIASWRFLERVSVVFFLLFRFYCSDILLKLELR